MENLKIIQKIYELVVYYQHLFIKFPKSYKYTLGDRINNSLIGFYLLILKVNRSKNKKTLEDNIDLKLDEIRLLVRMSRELNLISLKQYDVFSDKYVEVFNMIKK